MPMHASAAGAKARLLSARLAVDMIATESFLCEIVGCRSAILEGWSNSDISGADIVTHSSPSGRDTSKKRVGSSRRISREYGFRSNAVGLSAPYLGTGCHVDPPPAAALHRRVGACGDGALRSSDPHQMAFVERPHFFRFFT